MVFTWHRCRREARIALALGLACGALWSSAQEDFVAKAREAKATGRVDVAIALLRDGLVADPDNAVAHYVLGWLYVGKGQRQDAIAAFRRAIELAPDTEEGREAKAALSRIGADGTPGSPLGAPPATAANLPRPTPRAVSLVSAGEFATLQEALHKADRIFIPAGTYELGESLIIEGKEDVVLIGSGRMDSGARLRFKQGNGLRIRNCRRVLVCNLWIMPYTTFDAPAVEVTGDSPCEVTFLNVMVTGGTIAGPDRGSGAPGLAITTPGRVVLQACHFFHADPGLLVAHPQADVSVLGGNFQSDLVHIRQTAGHVELYCIGFQGAHGGADIELNAASAEPFVIAGCRTEGPKYLLRVPDTNDAVDVVVKACSIAIEEAPIARYDAAGTLVLMGNNAPGGIEAPNCTGTIWSVGNKLGGTWAAMDPYAVGPRARVFAAGDLWTLYRVGRPYVDPGNVYLEPDTLSGHGRRAPENVVFLESGAEPPPLSRSGSVPVVTMPIVENVAELLPSVRTYGAKGDGKTDDTEALQTALATHRNQALHFPAGRYRVTKPLFLDHWGGGWWVGAGADKTEILNVDGAEDGVVRTDGCGYAAFQDMSFVARKGAETPAFDLSQHPDHPRPPDALGAALQGNVFCRCRFVGGGDGLSIGRERFMGSETLIADCDFQSSALGLAVGCYNALTNNAVRCLFRDNGWAVAQADAGSFNVLDSRLEGSTHGDLYVTQSAGDAYWVYNTSSTSPRAIGTGNTGGIVNVLFEGFRHEGGESTQLVKYCAGGILLFLDSELGVGRIEFGGNVAHSCLLLLGSRLASDDQIELTHRRARALVFDGSRQ